MNPLSEMSVACPYCGESIDVLVDTTDLGQAYIEDCQVCCRPITIVASEDMNGELAVLAYSENESF